VVEEVTMGAEADLPAERALTPMNARESALVPAWLRRMTALGWRVLVIAAFGAVCAQLALTLSTVTMAILVGGVVGATVSPIVRHLRVNRSWSAGRAAGLASLAALATVIAIVLLIVIAFVPYVGNVIDAAKVVVNEVLNRLAQLGLPQPVLDYIDRLASGLQGWLADAVRQMVGPVGTLVTVLILAGFLTFYLLADADRAWARLTAGLDGWRSDSLTATAVSSLVEVGDYLRATGLTAVASGVTVTVWLLLLGVPLAGPLGVLVFLGGFVPYVGALFTTIVVVVMALAAGGVVTAVAMLVLIAITAAVLRWAMARFVYRRAPRIHPALILLVVPGAAAVFGIAGLFLAVPVAVTAIAFAPTLARVLGSGPSNEAGTRSVPTWLDRLAQWSWRGLVVVTVVAVGIQTLVGPFLSAPVVIALVIACAMRPAWNGLVRRGVGPTPAALVVALASAAVVTLILVVTVVAVIQQLPQILQEASLGAADINLGTSPQDLVGTIGPTLVNNAGSIVSNTASISVALVVSALLTFFFVRDGGVWWSRLLARIPADRRQIVGESGAKAARILNGSTVGTGLVSLVAGTPQFLMMTLLGLPLAFPVGVLTFFGGFIPYVGGAIATGLGFLIAIAAGTPATIVLMAIFTVVINIVIGNFVAPFVLGKTVSIHPAIVLLAAPAGAAIGGLIGMFLIVPMIAIFMATWRSVIRLFDPDEGQPVMAAQTAPPAPAQTASPSPALSSG
jgi:putative heme transporter